MFGNTNETIWCTDGEVNFLQYFDLTLAPDLLYYSYISIIIISLILGIFVLVKNKFSLIGKILFTLTFVFSIFISNELVQWIVMPAAIMHFTYSLSLLLQSLILIFTFYFVYIFVTGRDLSLLNKIFICILLSPIVLFLPNTLTLQGVDINSCSGIPGILWNYFYVIEFSTALFFLGWSIYTFKKYMATKEEQVLASFYLLLGAAAFLLIFFASYYFADLTGVYDMNLIGPIGMLIFIGVISYLIVKFKSFAIELLATQALIVVLVVLTGSQFLYVEKFSSHILTAITVVLIIFFGYKLVQSVKREIKLREQIEGLVADLDKANIRLNELDKMKSEFVSIASHQLRSPLTSIRGYTSMLQEGTYGKIPQKAKEVIEKIAESSNFMALSIEDYLNVSRIEAGNMKYEMSDFNIKDIAERMVDELRSVAIKKGLLLIFKSDSTGSNFVHADIGKVRQVIMNLLDNAIKYTLKGSITVLIHDNVKKKKIYVSIQDTGVGMSEDTIESIFDKFVRAKNANCVNVTGTGLGLYVARKMVVEMGGIITAVSEGEKKGSTFTIEFPLLPGTQSK